MSPSTSSLQQDTTSSQNTISGTQKLRRGASKILQKMNLSKGEEGKNMGELGFADIQVARFVTFTQPTAAPQIIDLKAMRQNVRPQLTRINTHQPRLQRSQADLNSHELHLQRSFEGLRAPTETGTPSRRDPQQAFVFETQAALDDIAGYLGYDMLDDKDSDLDWSLLDLPENVYRRLANESRHSLI